MALSEQDRAALDAMELGLSGGRSRSGAGRRGHEPRSLRSRIDAVGLVIAGLALTALGLALQSGAGDALSVVGFMLTVAAVWNATRHAGTWRCWMTAQIGERTKSGRPTT